MEIKTTNRKLMIERTVVIKQLSDLQNKVSKVRTDVLFNKNYKDIDFSEFINYLKIYQEFFENIKK